MKKILIAKLMCVTAAVGLLSFTPSAFGQGFGSRYEVNEESESVEVIAGSSRRLKFDYKVPELMVENPEVIKATPVAPNEILISGLKPGISTITVSDPDRALQTITIHVTVDVRKLEKALKTHFPDSKIDVHPLQTGIILKGYVAKQAQIGNVVAVARDYFPTNVINQIQVDGSQMVAIKVKVYEVSRTKLRKLGVDWSVVKPGRRGIVSSVSDLIQEFSLNGGEVTGAGQNITAGFVSGNYAVNTFIEALEQNNVAKLLDQPTLVTQHGRPAEFLSGGEIPIAIASGLGTVSIEFKPFGTKLDIVPLVHGGGEMTLEIRAEVSEIDNALSSDTGVPGFRTRRVNTGVKMRAGHTLALAGDFREEDESEVAGVPKLMDGSILGPLFRRTESVVNETELVFLVTPNFISDVPNTQLPQGGPGRLTGSPSDHEMYRNGYIEVPRCQDDCPINDRSESRIPVQQNLLPHVQQSEQHQPGFMPQGFSGQPMQQIGNPVMNGNSNGIPSTLPTTSTPIQQQPAGGFDWPTQGNGG